MKTIFRTLMLTGAVIMAAGCGSNTSKTASAPVAEVEVAVRHHHVGGLLQGGFAVGRAVKQTPNHIGMADAVKGALLVQSQARKALTGRGNGDMFHGIFLYLFCMNQLRCAKAAYAQLGRKPKCGQCLPFARNIISDVAATA